MGTVTINSLTINNASGIGAKYGPFYYNTMITSVDLSNSTWTNNSMVFAFNGCTKLTTVTNLNQNITTMHGTFYGCYDLVNAPVIPNSVTDMSYTFIQCRKLANIPVIPNSVTNLAETFQNCHSLINAPIIPNSVTIMYRTFGTCNILTTAPIIPDSVTTIAGLFDQCSNLQSFPSPIPHSITNMYATFYDCKNLQGDIYVDSTQIINATSCFGNITNTRNVYIPFNSSLLIYTNTYNAFNTAGYITPTGKDGVTIKENPHFEVSGDWWWCNYDGILHKYLGTAASITIPNSINGKNTSIDGYVAFSYSSYRIYNGRQITSLNLNNTCIKNSLVNFLSGANYITSIQNINVDSNVKNASYAFEGCSSLTSAPSLPDGITEMLNTYKECSALTSMPALPNTVINAQTLFYVCNFNSWSTTMTFPDSLQNYSGITSTNKDPNKAFNITVGKNAINLSGSFSKFYGNCYIRSNQVTDASTCFSYRNNFRKNVYIPFKNSDGTNSATYNAFIGAGYRTDGSYCNVYLMNYTDLYS